MARLLLEIGNSIYGRNFTPGLASEVQDGIVSIYHEDAFPIIEIFSRLDDYGNPIDSNETLEEFAKLIADFLNTKAGTNYSK